MPIYDVECESCGKTFENVWAGVHEVTTCPCGAPMKRLLGPTSVSPDLEPYLDDNLGQRPIWIKSRQHRDRILKDRGLAIK